LQQLSDDTQLITLACTKNRFGRSTRSRSTELRHRNFQVTDSPEFLKYNADLDTLSQLIERTPGLSQNAIYKKCGMRKSRLSELLKAGCGRRWEERKEGSALLYFPPVPVFGNNREQAEQVQKNLTGLTVVPKPPYRGLGNNKPGDTPDTCSRPVPGTNGKTLSSCPECRSFAVYPEQDGSMFCMTCENKFT
jgi:hypothetical protein